MSNPKPIGRWAQERDTTIWHARHRAAIRNARSYIDTGEPPTGTFLNGKTNKRTIHEKKFREEKIIRENEEMTQRLESIALRKHCKTERYMPYVSKWAVCREIENRRIEMENSFICARLNAAKSSYSSHLTAKHPISNPLSLPKYNQYLGKSVCFSEARANISLKTDSGSLVSNIASLPWPIESSNMSTISSVESSRVYTSDHCRTLFKPSDEYLKDNLSDSFVYYHQCTKVGNGQLMIVTASVEKKFMTTPKLLSITAYSPDSCLTYSSRFSLAELIILFHGSRQLAFGLFRQNLKFTKHLWKKLCSCLDPYYENVSVRQIPKLNLYLPSQETIAALQIQTLYRSFIARRFLISIVTSVRMIQAKFRGVKLENSKFRFDTIINNYVTSAITNNSMLKENTKMPKLPITKNHNCTYVNRARSFSAHFTNSGNSTSWNENSGDGDMVAGTAGNELDLAVKMNNRSLVTPIKSESSEFIKGLEKKHSV